MGIDWKGGLKIIATETGKGIAKAAQVTAKEIDKQRQNMAWKNQILNRMYNPVVMSLAREKKIEPFGEKPTADDYRREIALRVSLNDIVEFAQRRGVPIKDIVAQIRTAEQERKLDKQIATLGPAALANNFNEIVQTIREFEPLGKYSKEIKYHRELAQWIKSRYPDTQIEVPRGASRPDIVANGIAIEVKGPTRDRELQTIADKCMRYSDHFRAGFIVVLFTLEASPRRFQEWEAAMQRQYPGVVIITK